MTDRYNSLTVILDREIREDDAQQLMNAIRCLKGVIDVSGNVADYESYAAYSKARYDLMQKLADVLK